MEKTGTKRFSYGGVFALAVLLFLLVAGAMFFADETADFFAHHEPKITEAMELQGSWLGMRLTSLDSPTARRLGVPPSAPGVMIVEIEKRNGWRARQAGAMEGDVIVGVDGKAIRDLSDLYDVSRNLDVGSAVLLDIRRVGQPMTLVVPALHAPPPGAAPSQPGQAGIPAQVMAPGANAALAQPAAWVPGLQGPQFYCPIHSRMWSQNAVHPHYRCPLGNCPLSRAR
jgi:hypothetical protein